MNVGIELRSRPRQLPFTLFPIHCSRWSNLSLPRYLSHWHRRQMNYKRTHNKRCRFRESGFHLRVKPQVMRRRTRNLSRVPHVWCLIAWGSVAIYIGGPWERLGSTKKQISWATQYYITVCLGATGQPPHWHLIIKINLEWPVLHKVHITSYVFEKVICQDVKAVIQPNEIDLRHLSKI
jgi:hypothetical protein